MPNSLFRQPQWRDIAADRNSACLSTACSQKDEGACNLAAQRLNDTPAEQSWRGPQITGRWEKSSQLCHRSLQVKRADHPKDSQKGPQREGTHCKFLILLASKDFWALCSFFLTTWDGGWWGASVSEWRTGAMRSQAGSPHWRQQLACWRQWGHVSFEGGLADEDWVELWISRWGCFVACCEYGIFLKQELSEKSPFCLNFYSEQKAKLNLSEGQWRTVTVTIFF